MRATTLLLLLIERNTYHSQGVWAALDQMTKESPGSKGESRGGGGGGTSANELQAFMSHWQAGSSPGQPEALGWKPLLVTPSRWL